MPVNTGPYPIPGYTNTYGASTSPSASTSSPYQTLLGQYNLVPQPTSGRGAYGLVPGTTPLPPSTFSQTTSAVPSLGPATTTATNNIMSELEGELSPQALENMQNTAARFGVSSGMPGSNAIPGTLANNSNLLGNILTTQQIQSQGLKDYGNLEGEIAGQQLNPSLISGINESNAQLAAAPDPTAAAQAELANYYAALNAAKGPAGGTGITPTPASATGQLPTAPTGAIGTPSPAYPTIPGVPGVSTVGASNAIDAGTQDITSFLNDLLGLGVPSGGTGADQSGLGDTSGLVPAGAIDTGTQFDPTDPSTWGDTYG